MSHNVTEEELRDVLSPYGLSGAEKLTPLEHGLINQTFLVESGEERYILQRLHPVFAPEVNLDIDAVTTHLAACGILTPRLVRTADGALWVSSEGCWRLQTYVVGRVAETVRSAQMACEAARLAARFHKALLTLDHAFSFSRPGVHDTAAHLRDLASAMDRCRSHPDFDRIAPVGQEISELSSDFAVPEGLPQRIVHGDLKITNVMFDDALTAAVALIDLDTVARNTLAVELGDALRSWCNPLGEEHPGSSAVPEIFGAATAGYAEGAEGFVTAAERESIVTGAVTISLELAARFCRDAFEERYFGWDPKRFPSRSAHNLVRAISQLAVAKSFRAQAATMEELCKKAFS